MQKRAIASLVVLFGTSLLIRFHASSQPSTPTKPQPVSFSCAGVKPAFPCYEAYYTDLVNASGIPAAFDDLKARYAKDPYAQSVCHSLTHAIGHAAFKLFPTVNEAFQHGDSFCWSGFYHGVMEEAAKTIGKDKLVQDLDAVCADIPGKDRYSFDYYNCVHGLGHGLMSVTEDELFESLTLCDGLTGDWEKQSCYGGVFMENVMADGVEHVTKYLKPKEPLYPCTAVDDHYKGQCYLMQTSYVGKLNGYDFKKTFAACATVASPYDVICYQSLGRDASGNTVSHADKVKAICALGKNQTQRDNCLIGAVKDFVSYFHSDVQARRLCSIIPADETKLCENTVDSFYVSFQK